jgi:medium-chain acyl-[acyl-carrier-protein] hydrolase
LRIYRPRPIEQPIFRLICFPYAGGSAVFFSKWLRSLPAGVELSSVEYPGHGSRLREPPSQTLEEIITHAARDVLPLLEVPFAFFGHSMGALVAFEIARRFAAGAGPIPRRLFLSARGAPHLPRRQRPSRSTLPAADLIKVMLELGGSAQVIAENEELINLFLPPLRADLRALETWEYKEGPPLTIPFSLFGAADDTAAPWPRVEAWEALTTAPTNKHLFSGGHFYIQDNYPAVVATIMEELRSVL